MAIPLIPIFIIAGVAMFAGGAGKKSGKKTATTAFPLQEGAKVYIPVGTMEPEGEPVFGALCGTHADREQGVWSAYSKNGECFVFWDQDTDAAMTYYIQEAFDQSGFELDEVCAPAPGWEGDPFDQDPDVVAEWIPNPIQVNLLKQALAKAYPQIPQEMFPPPQTLGPEDVGVPDYVEVVWVFAMSVLLREVCGYVPVT